VIHVYYGDGQGKTSAAAGLALRAVAAGRKVCLVQFLKDGRSGEARVLRGLPGVTALACTAPVKFTFEMTPAELDAVREEHENNLASALRMADAGACDLLVLDEALDARAAGVLGDALLREAVERGKFDLELVVTGHTLPVYVLDAANYVTRMDCVRHPFACGVPAREGVEF